MLRHQLFRPPVEYTFAGRTGLTNVDEFGIHGGGGVRCVDHSSRNGSAAGGVAQVQKAAVDILRCYQRIVRNAPVCFRLDRRIQNHLNGIVADRTVQSANGDRAGPTSSYLHRLQNRSLACRARSRQTETPAKTTHDHFRLEHGQRADQHAHCLSSLNVQRVAVNIRREINGPKGRIAVIPVFCWTGERPIDQVPGRWDTGERGIRLRNVAVVKNDLSRIGSHRVSIKIRDGALLQSYWPCGFRCNLFKIILHCHLIHDDKSGYRDAFKVSRVNRCRVKRFIKPNAKASQWTGHRHAIFRHRRCHVQRVGVEVKSPLKRVKRIGIAETPDNALVQRHRLSPLSSDRRTGELESHGIRVCQRKRGCRDAIDPKVRSPD